MARKRVSVRATKDVLLVNGADLIIYSDDQATEEMRIDGATGDVRLKDNAAVEFGDSTDVEIKWDGTNLLFVPAADDTLIEFGDAAATQKSFDIKCYGNDANGASYWQWDASANQMVFMRAGLKFDGGGVTSIFTLDAAATNLFNAVASGDGGITVSADGMTANPETDAEAGYITISVAGTSYQIPFYTA